MASVDQDGDGIPDSVEERPEPTLSARGDNDGIPEGPKFNLTKSVMTGTPDADGDGQPDALEDDSGDQDDDGVPDAVDPCDEDRTALWLASAHHLAEQMKASRRRDRSMRRCRSNSMYTRRTSSSARETGRRLQKSVMPSTMTAMVQ